MSTKSEHLSQPNGPTQGTTIEQFSDEQVESGTTKHNKDPLPYDYGSGTDSKVENGEFTGTESKEGPLPDEEGTAMEGEDGSPKALAPAPQARQGPIRD